MLTSWRNTHKSWATLICKTFISVETVSYEKSFYRSKNIPFICSFWDGFSSPHILTVFISIQYNNITDKICVAASQDLRKLGVFPNAVICIFAAPPQAAKLIHLIRSVCLSHHAWFKYLCRLGHNAAHIWKAICFNHLQTSIHIMKTQNAKLSCTHKTHDC